MAESPPTIRQVVGEHVTLRRNGHLWSGLCPFHVESTPSFLVNTKTDSFHCFGCGATGTADDFVRLIAREPK
jgi:DNA primase